MEPGYEEAAAQGIIAGINVLPSSTSNKQFIIQDLSDTLVF